MVGIGDDSQAAIPQVWERMESRLSAPLATPTQMPAGRQWRSAWGWGSGSAAVGVPRLPRATPAAAGGATCRHQCLVWPGSSCSPACCHHRCCRQQQGVRASEGSKQGQAWPYFMTDRPVARPQAGRRRRRRGVGVDCVAQEANTIMCICHVLKLAVHVA